MLAIKSHTLHVRPPDQAVSDHRVLSVTSWLEGAREVSAQVRPLSTAAAFAAYGIESGGVSEVYIELEDAPLLDRVNTLLWVVERKEWLKTLARPLRRDSTLAAHAVVACQLASPPGGTTS